MLNDDITVNIGLSEQDRKSLADKLDLLLANEFTLYVRTLNYHWNLMTPMFSSLHKAFEHQYEDIFKAIDLIAEHIRALGRPCFGTLVEFATNSTLKEHPTIPEIMPMIYNLLEGHETVIRQMRDIITLADNVKSYGTSNMLGNLTEEHEKTAWMLRAHLS